MVGKHKLNQSNMKMLLTHLGALVAVSCWGFAFVATKILMDGGITLSPDNITLSPTETYCYRFIIAYIIILCISHRKIFCDTLGDELLLALCGMLSGSLYFIAENTALEFTLTTNVSLLTSTSPLITVLIVGLLYKSERPGKGLIIGSLIAFGGMCCVILNSATSLEIRPLGDLLAIGASICWALYSLIIKKINVVYDAWFITRKTFFYGILTAFPFLLFEPELSNPIKFITHGWPWADASLIFLALVPSVISFYLWTICIKRLGPITSNNYMYLQPVVTLLASAILLGERVSTLGYIGFALILLGLWAGYYIDHYIKFKK